MGDDLSDLMELLEAASLAPWKAVESKDSGKGWPVLFNFGEGRDGRRWSVIVDGRHASESPTGDAKDDAALVAEMRNRLPAIIKELRELRARA